MYLELETRNKALFQLFSIPIIGGTIFLLLMATPAALTALGLSALFHYSKETEFILFCFLFTVTDWVLRFAFNTKFRILFFPSWVVFLGVGLVESYKKFQ